VFTYVLCRPLNCTGLSHRTLSALPCSDARLRSASRGDFVVANYTPTVASRTVHFLSLVSILTHDIDIAILSVYLSVCLSVRRSVRCVPVGPLFYRNGLTYCHNFFTTRYSPIILVLQVSNTFMKFRQDHPLRGR